MQTVSNAQLKKGMVTAAPITTKHGQIVVDTNITLSDPLIARIRFYGIDSIQIHDFSEPKAEPVKADSERTKEPTYLERIRGYADFQNFQASHTKAVKQLQALLEPVIFCNGMLDTDAVYRIAEPLLSKVSISFEVCDVLHNLRSIDDSIYAHSINVALISNMLGKWLKLSQKELDILVTASLLHDIGKAKIPAKILNKPEKYTQDEIILIKKHPAFGYLLLLPHTQINPHIVNAALMHHERSDGSGYPQNLLDKETDPYAQIIAIADVYDAMTAARSYREPLCPFQVIADFENDGLQKYNPKFILTFLEGIAYNYQNNRVQLTDGREANIIMLNRQFLSKPIVQASDGTCIDLSRTPDLRIQALL